MVFENRLAQGILVLGVTAAVLARPQPLAADSPVQEALGVGAFTVQQLTLPATSPDAFRVDIALDGQRRTLHLSSCSVRAEGFRVRAQDQTGRLREIEPPPPCTYRGHVVGRPNSRVAGSLIRGNLRAGMRLEDGTHWWVQPLSSVLPGSHPSSHAVYRARDIRPGPWQCGTGPAQDFGPGPLPPAAGGRAGDLPVLALVAFDADVEFYELNDSSVDDTVSDIESVMNGVTDIYENEVDITYQITEIIVRTTEPDPYATTDGWELFDVFMTYWNDNEQDVVRDAAYLMTGKNLDGSLIGVGAIGVICAIPQSSYGLSQSRFSSNAAMRVGLTAHELGHNWRANHCNGDSDCSIMCSFIGGCAGDVTSFGSAATGEIVDWRDAHECLSAESGACCLADTTCLDALTPGECDVAGGVFQGAGSTCASAVDCPCVCDCSLPGDGQVNVMDFLAILAQWGSVGSTCDIDGGGVGATDFLMLLANWGPCP